MFNKISPFISFANNFNTSSLRGFCRSNLLLVINSTFLRAKINLKAIIIILLFCVSQSFLYAQGYKIDVQIKQLADSNIYLGYHYGNEQYVIDTAHLNKSGIGIFEGKNALPVGVYMIVFPNMKYFDILMPSQQVFKIKNDTVNLNDNFEVEGSNENEIYSKYQKFSSEKLSRIAELSKVNNLINQKQTDSLQLVIRNERNRIIKLYPNTFFASLLKSMLDPEIPENIANADNPADYEKKMNYLTLHYFDNYDFNNENLLFSPVLYNKVLNYYGKLIENNSDTIINSIDNILGKSLKNPEVYHFLLNSLLSTFDLSGEIPNDEAFVHIAENYYLKELAPWVNEDFIGRLKKHVSDLKPTLIGATAPSLILSDTASNKLSLYDIKSCFTLVIFWNPECEHCAEYLAELKNAYDSYDKEYFQVYAVLATDNQKKWKTYIQNNKFKWLNVYDATKKNDFIQTYKLFMIPRIYLLDNNKHIVLKDFEVNELKLFLNNRKKTDCK